MAWKLTNKQCVSVAYSPEGKNKLFDGYGLHLEVMPSGSKFWRHKYRRPNGKENRLSYGPFPEITLQKARELCELGRALLREGKDPAIEREQTKSQVEQASKNTFEAVAMDWFDNYKSGWVPRHAQNILNRLRGDIFPGIGHLPIGTIDAPTVLAAIRKIEQRGAPHIAKRTGQYCSKIFNYAIGTGRGVTLNPAQGLTQLLKPHEKGNFTRIDIKQMPEFLKALNADDVAARERTLQATKLLMLTLVRTDALIRAKWDEFDFENVEWTIPSVRVKVKGRPPFVVPLSRQAVTILNELKAESGRYAYVFPHNSKAKEHMSNCSILAVLYRIGYKGVMTGHGFRSLGADTLRAVLGHPQEIVDKCLGHQEQNKVTGAYFRDPLLEQRRVLMQDWADFVDYCSMLGQTVENPSEYNKIEKLLREYATGKQSRPRLVKAG